MAFINKVSSVKADRIVKKRRDERIADMAVTFIAYCDTKYWGKAEWMFVYDNKVMLSRDGFYIKTSLFKDDDVSKSKKVS